MYVAATLIGADAAMTPAEMRPESRLMPGAEFPTSAARTAVGEGASRTAPLNVANFCSGWITGGVVGGVVISGMSEWCWGTRG